VELKIWSPFSNIEREWPLTVPRILGELGFRPSVDVVKREGGELVVTAELAGIDPKEVEITLDNGILTLKGEKLEDKEISEEDRYIHERSYGKFQRRIPMPDGVTADKIVATSDNGVLTINVAVPKEATTKPHTIPVVTK
jgi:HSP20 family protein